MASAYADIYATYANQAHTAYQNALIATQAQRNQYLTSQGVIGQYDPTSGRMTGYDFGSNPAGGYQQMLGGMAQTSDGMQASMRNLGFKGGLANAHQAAADTQAGAQYTDWAQRFLGTTQGFNAQNTQDEANYNNSLANEQAMLTAQGAKAGDFGAADTTGITVDGQGNGVVPAPGMPGSTDPWGSGTSGNTGSNTGTGHPANSQMVWVNGAYKWLPKSVNTRMVKINGHYRRVRA